MADENAIMVKVNTSNFYRQLGQAEGKVKRMTALGLNGLAFRIRKKDLPLGMDKNIDRPTPFTRRGGRVLKAKARDFPQVAWVYIAPIQEGYLKTIVKGGTRTDKLPVPGKEASRNKYGNLPRNATKGKKVFFLKRGVGRGVHAKRVGPKKKRRLVIIAHWPFVRRYKKTFPLFEVVRKAASLNYNQELRKAFGRVFK